MSSELEFVLSRLELLAQERRKARERERRAEARVPTMVRNVPAGLDASALAAELFAWLETPAVVAACARMSGAGLGAVGIACEGRRGAEIARLWLQLLSSRRFRIESVNMLKGPRHERPTSPQELAEQATPALLWAAAEAFRSGRWRDYVLGAAEAALESL